MKKIVYVDMDGVLVDLQAKIDSYPPEYVEKFGEDVDKIPGLFYDPPPMPGAIDAFNTLRTKYDVYILSTAPWDAIESLTFKRQWVEKYLGEGAYKRLILSHNKHLNIGDYLIDDRTKNGADKFTGELIQFGTDKFKTWNEVLQYLM